MSDVWDSAANAKVGPRVYFGQIFTDAFYVYVSKGEPKVPFNRNEHPMEKRFTQIKIGAMCEKADGTTYDINREIIAEFGREWAGIVLPSLKVCGYGTPGQLAQLNEKWARWEMVETGRIWTDDLGKDHQVRTFKFLEIYDSEDACRAAETAYYNRPIGTDDASLPMPEATEPVNNSPEKAVAAKFLPALLDQANGDIGEFMKLIANYPLTRDHFTLDSPEVIELVLQKAPHY